MTRRRGIHRVLYFVRWQLAPVLHALPGHVALVMRGLRAAACCGPVMRLQLAWHAVCIHLCLECGHNPIEVLHIIEEIIELSPSRPGVVVECGTFMGGSTAKLSWAAALTGRKLIVCDSFEGLPDVGMADHVASKRDFRRGEYFGRLDQVQANVARFGRPQLVGYVVGWFDKSLHELNGIPIACAFWDVDLLDSFRACIRLLWKNVQPGSKVFIHDIDRQPVVDTFADPLWWKEQMGMEPPRLVGALTGLGHTSSLIGYAWKSV